MIEALGFIRSTRKKTIYQPQPDDWPRTLSSGTKPQPPAAPLLAIRTSSWLQEGSGGPANPEPEPRTGTPHLRRLPRALSAASNSARCSASRECRDAHAQIATAVMSAQAWYRGEAEEEQLTCPTPCLLGAKSQLIGSSARRCPLTPPPARRPSR